MSAAGGSFNWFGPYYLDVGCTTTSVVFTDSPAFVTNVPIFVGDSVVAKYTLAIPTASRTWCYITDNRIVNNDATGTTWSGLNTVSPTQGCTS